MGKIRGRRISTKKRIIAGDFIECIRQIKDRINLVNLRKGGDQLLSYIGLISSEIFSRNLTKMHPWEIKEGTKNEWVVDGDHRLMDRVFRFNRRWFR